MHQLIFIFNQQLSYHKWIKLDKPYYEENLRRFSKMTANRIESNCCQLHHALAAMQMNRYFSGFNIVFACNFSHAIVLTAIVTLKSFISHNHQECIFNINAQTSLISLPLLVYIACNLFYIHTDSQFPSCGYWHKQIVNQA